MAKIVEAAAPLVIAVGGGLVAGGGGDGFGQEPRQGIMGEARLLALGIGLRNEPGGIVVAVAPGSEIGVRDADPPAEAITAVGPLVGGGINTAPAYEPLLSSSVF